jgi:hypothetical protein
MKRQDPITIVAELDHITSDVRDLDVSPSRAAALQCLADARAHLANLERSIQTSPFRSVALASVPPSAADNQPARNKANECFRESRRLLREVIK